MAYLRFLVFTLRLGARRDPLQDIIFVPVFFVVFHILLACVTTYIYRDA